MFLGEWRVVHLVDEEDIGLGEFGDRQCGFVPIVAFHGYFDRSGFNLCFFKKWQQSGSGPFCVANQVAACGVADAFHGAVKRFLGCVEDVLEGEDDRGFDFAPQFEIPGVEVDAGGEGVVLDVKFAEGGDEVVGQGEAEVEGEEAIEGLRSASGEEAGAEVCAGEGEEGLEDLTALHGGTDGNGVGGILRDYGELGNWGRSIGLG